jgi:tetratricopeptide (TPR) repeat protein
MGRSDDALEILQHLTARELDPDPLNLLAHLAQDAGDVRLSLEAFEKALQVAPDSEQNYLDYSTLCMGYGNTALGLEIVKRGLERIPHSYRLTVQEGAFLASLGRPQEAEKAFQSATRLQDDSKEAFLGLAIVQASSDQFDAALKTYADGVKRFPNDFNLNFYYAFALFRSTQTEGLQHETVEKVRSVIARAIQLNPRSGSAYYLRAKYYTVMDPNPGLAIENLESCLRLEPRYVPAKYQLALLYRREGKQQESENLLKQVREVQAEELKKEQDHPRIVINRGAPIILGKELP